MIRLRDLRSKQNLTVDPWSIHSNGLAELLMPQRRHGIHMSSAASRDIAREQGNAHQQDADGSIGCWIRGLHVKKPEVLLHEPIESER